MNFLAALLRSFTIQASWNYNRLQAIGWSVTIEPLLRLLPGGKHGRSYRDSMSRACQYFNSHPFFANFAIGAVARAELKGVEPEEVEKFRDAIKGALGAVGDRLVWAGLLPVTSAMGLVATVVFSPMVGVATFLIAFNIVHVTIRIWGLREGWRRGFGVAKALHGGVLQGSIKVGEYAAPFAYGFATTIVAQRLLAEFDSTARIAALGAAAVTVACLRWFLPRVGAARLGLAAIVVALLIGKLWV